MTSPRPWNGSPGRRRRWLVGDTRQHLEASWNGMLRNLESTATMLSGDPVTTLVLVDCHV